MKSDIKHPFAAARGIFVFGDLERPDRCEIGIYIPKKTASDAGKSEYIEYAMKQISGKKAENLLINEIVADFSLN